MRIAVIGAGPAGSRAAARLARAGHDVALIDRSFDREKPCGGGVPWAGLTEIRLRGFDSGIEEAIPSNTGQDAPQNDQTRIRTRDIRDAHSGNDHPTRKDLSEASLEGCGAEGDPGGPEVAAPQTEGLPVRRLIFETFDCQRFNESPPMGPHTARPSLDSPLSHSGLKAEVLLPHPVVVFSRRALDRSLVEEARGSGARLVKDSVVLVEKVSAADSWRVSLASGKTLHADHIVGADGARSLVRRTLGTPFKQEDLSQAVGWYVPGVRSETMTIRFDSRIRGYLWIFPRADHLAVGACAALAPGIVERLWSGARELLVKLGLSEDGLPRYSALIPSLGPESLRANQVAGEGWSLVGDAAGTVDPLTREGIRHGLRSADLLADAFVAGYPESYGTRWRDAFYPEFSWAAARRDRFFDPRLTSRLVRYLSRSSAIRRVMVDLVLGRQDYPTLKRRLVRTALPAGVELGVAKARAWLNPRP